PPGILGVAVDRARTVLGGRTAGAWLRNGDQLVPGASDGEVLAGRALAVGWGLAGEVAAAGRGRVDGMTSATAEPQRDTALAVPLHVNGEVFAVVAVYGRQAGRSRFSADDLDTLAALVQPAESAIENALLHDEATRLSVTDALTGLANRRELDRRFEAEVERHARFGEGFGLLLVDLDDFKEINDRFGHQAGDAVLVEVAGRVRGVTREVDVVARYGGEELAVLLPRADAAAAARTAERIRGAVADKPVRFGREARAVTCSVGVAALPQDAADLGALVAAADAALYRAKRAGKNRVERVA
ncbi:MAG: GGDEF domain-containing protein, partial [Acidimicrobiia bacterium]